MSASLAGFFRRRLAIARNRRALHDLSDAVLADLGVRRREIDSLVAERLDSAGRRRGPYPL